MLNSILSAIAGLYWLAFISMAILWVMGSVEIYFENKAAEREQKKLQESDKRKAADRQRKEESK